MQQQKKLRFLLFHYVFKGTICLTILKCSPAHHLNTGLEPAASPKMMDRSFNLDDDWYEIMSRPVVKQKLWFAFIIPILQLDIWVCIINFFFSWWCFTYFESALQMHTWSKKTTMRSFWHFIPISSCHYRSTMSLVEVFRSSEIYLSRHFAVSLVLSLSLKGNLAFLMQHYIPSHQTPTLPSAEFQRDLIGLEKNKNTLWWKWSGGSLCCVP